MSAALVLSSFWAVLTLSRSISSALFISHRRPDDQGHGHGDQQDEGVDGSSRPVRHGHGDQGKIVFANQNGPINSPQAETEKEKVYQKPKGRVAVPVPRKPGYTNLFSEEKGSHATLYEISRQMRKPARKKATGEIPDGKAEDTGNGKPLQDQKARQRYLDGMKKAHPVSPTFEQEIDVGKHGSGKEKVHAAGSRSDEGRNGKGRGDVRPELHDLILFTISRKLRTPYQSEGTCTKVSPRKEALSSLNCS